MATTTTLLLTITFKPALQPDPSSPPAAFADVCARLRAAPGAAALSRGRLLERPAAWLLAVRWAAPAALDGFLASPARADWLAALRAVADSCLFARADLAPDPAPALDAPCTEVLAAHGADGDFLDARLAPFARALDAEAMDGFHASAVGPLEVVMRDGDADPPPEGPSFVMLIGWDSKEAHLAHRGDGKTINKHIGIVREGRKSVQVYHVNLTKL